MENVSEKNFKVILFLSRKSPAISRLHLGEKLNMGRIQVIQEE